MSIDEMKTQWNKDQVRGSLDEATLQKIVKSRVRKHTGTAFKYFWAAFALQILVYSMLTHVIIRYWDNPTMTLPSLLGIAAYIPFTVLMMRRFKSIAVVGQSSMRTYVARQIEILQGFYQFKRNYELVLIPLATAIGTFLVFELYVPGSVWAYPKGALITFFASLASCIIAIQAENKRAFEGPLSQMKSISDELDAQ
jgi:hypothetical protein